MLARPAAVPAYAASFRSTVLEGIPPARRLRAGAADMAAHLREHMQLGTHGVPRAGK
jgi:hypothetical protein